MSEGSTFALAPGGETDSLKRRIDDLEAEVAELRRRTGTRDHGALASEDPEARTERKAAEQPAKASEERWRSLADAMPQFVWVAPRFGDLEFINQYWFEYTGLKEGDLDAASWTQVLHPHDLPAIAAMSERSTGSGAKETFEFRVKRASDGEWRWHLGFHSPVRGRGGEIVSWIGIAFDIHDRKLAEEALRTTEERQRLAVDAGAIGLWDWDIQSDRVVWSDRVYEFHGLTPETFGGTSEDFARMVHPADAERVRKAITDTVEEDKPYDLVFRVLRPDGSVHWLATKAQVIRDARGRGLRMVGATQDVTAARVAQQELDAAKEALQSLIEYAPDGVFVADSAGRYTNVNPAACALLGYSRAELLTMSVQELIRPEDRERQAQLIANLRAGKIEVSEWELKGRNGWIPVELSARLLPDGRMQGFVRDVRERRLLQSAALHMAAIVESSDDAIISKDLNGVIQSWNRSAERVFGYTAEEAIGKSVYILIPPDRQSEEPEILRRLQRGERVEHFETVRRRKDGTLLDISLTISPVKDAAGRIIGASKIARDITQQKRAEEALREREDELRRLLAAIPDVICRVDRDMRFVYANPAIERMTGMPPALFVGKTPDEAGLGSLAHELGDRLGAVLRSRGPEALEFDFDSPALGLRHLLGMAIPETEASGDVRSLLVIVRDVTEKKRAETERATALRREREARQTAELLNRVGPALAAELSLDRLVQSVTDIATELVGAEFGTFLHNVIDDKGESYMLYSLSGVSREAFKDFPLPGNTAVFGPTFRGEGIVLSADITKDPRYGRSVPFNGMPPGHLRVRSYLAVPVHSRSQEILGGLIFGHSAEGRFTEQHAALISGLAAQAAIALDNARLFEQSKWVQDELQRSNRDLRRANQDLETFAYSASHDLQEPLRMIAISAQLLERKAGDLTQDNKYFLKGILDGAGRMQTLIEDLLSYTRATRQGEGPVPVLDSRKVLEDVLQHLKPSLDLNHARVVISKLPSLAVHEVHLTQLFQNLISNALKYRSAEDPHVQISAVEREGWNVFSVSDNGLGIDPRFRDQIFGLFKRLHTRDQYPGSGIGLAICKRIVEQYGGRIWLEQSGLGRGSEFCFSLPAQPGAR